MFYLSNVLEHCSIKCVLHMHIPYAWDYSIVGHVGAEISIIVNTLTRTVLLKQGYSSMKLQSQLFRES